jgi:hypothetical protein
MNKSRGKPIPHNLPPRVQPCVNREREIEQVSQALLDPHSDRHYRGACWYR